VCENRVLRRIFGPKREEVAGDWRRLQNEELHNLRASSCIQHTWRDEKFIQNFLSENLNGTAFGIFRRSWKVILERILRKYDGSVWTGCINLRIGTGGGP
jgi:hypothetical protein